VGPGWLGLYLRVVESFSPLQPIHQLSGVDLQSLGEAEQTRQAEVSFTTLDAADEREMQSDLVCQLHLAKAEFLAARPSATTHFVLSRVPSCGSSHRHQ